MILPAVVQQAINDPYFWLTFGAYFYSSLIQALPSPTTNAAGWYVFIYKLLHALGANWKQYKQASIVSYIQSNEKLEKEGVSPNADKM